VTEPAHLHDLRTGYDAAAVVYAERFAGGLAAAVLDRALLAAFSELAPPPGTGSDAGSAGAGRAARVAADLLRDAGFVEIARLVREPAETERFPQATVLARRSTC
jgi:hypothetical protein